MLHGFLLALMAGCDSSKTELTWIPFNADDDVVDLQITALGDRGPALVADLHSTTGVAIIGSVLIDPGSGPVGTVHPIRVDLDPAFEDRVGKVDVEVDSAERGQIAFPLVQDSAQRWRWVVSLTSLGVGGEDRTDQLTFRVYELVEVIVEDDDKGLFGL